MNVFEAVNARRAVKHFDPEVKLSELEVEQLMSAVVLSPTSYNMQNWRFVRIRKNATREALLDAAWGQMQVLEAAELFVLCADIDAWKDQPQRYFANTDEATRVTLLGMLNNFYQGKEQVQQQEAFRSCGIAAQTMMLTAKAMGYDSCPMIGFDPELVAKIIKLPHNHVITMMVAVGKALKPAYPRAGQLPLSQVLVDNSF